MKEKQTETKRNSKQKRGQLKAGEQKAEVRRKAEQFKKKVWSSRLVEQGKQSKTETRLRGVSRGK